jgi:hypothetical protein
MVNYGYGPGCPNWNRNRQNILARQLNKLLQDMKLTRNTEIEHDVVLHEYPEPYIEVDGMYKGVRIRKITHLTDKESDVLVRNADVLYRQVMGIKNPVN